MLVMVWLMSTGAKRESGR